MYSIKAGSKPNEFYMEYEHDALVTKKLLFSKVTLRQYKQKPTDIADIVFAFGSKALVSAWEIHDDSEFSNNKLRHIYSANKKDLSTVIHTNHNIQSVTSLNESGAKEGISIIFPDIPEDSVYLVELRNLSNNDFIQRMKELEYSNTSLLKTFYAPEIIKYSALLLAIIIILLLLHSQNTI